MTRRYLSLTEVAERIGVSRAAAAIYKLPEPEVTVGKARGWLPETIDAWNAARPGHGGRPRKQKRVVTEKRRKNT
jgi:predicted DNA-binding transcriptional regulator AlpA